MQMISIMGGEKQLALEIAKYLKQTTWDFFNEINQILN